MIKGQTKNIYGYDCSAIPVVSNEKYYFLGMFDGNQLPGRWENAEGIFHYIEQMLQKDRNPVSYNNYNKYSKTL